MQHIYGLTQTQIKACSTFYICTRVLYTCTLFSTARAKREIILNRFQITSFAMFVNFQITECRQEKNEFFDPINSQSTCPVLICL